MRLFKRINDDATQGKCEEMCKDDEMTASEWKDKMAYDYENAYCHAGDTFCYRQASIEKANEAAKKLAMAAEAAWEISQAIIKGFPKKRPALPVIEFFKMLTSLDNDEGDEWWLKKMTPEARENHLKEEKRWDEEMPVWTKETQQKESLALSALFIAVEEWKRAREEVQNAIDAEKAACLHLDSLRANSP